MTATQAFAPHTARNLQPILEVLRVELASARSVLEIGSGNGQHATAIARELDQLVWQTSDRRCSHSDIQDWLAQSGVANVRGPMALDVLSDACPDGEYDAVFSANTAHIMSPLAVEKTFAIVAAVLRKGGVFCLYGPFRQDGNFSTESNAIFHRSLRSRDKEMGIRHLEEIDILAARCGLRRRGLYGMPANNLMVTWTTAQRE